MLITFSLISVAYTDVVQLICIAVGLWLTVPFSLTNEHVESIGARKEEWLGTLYGAKVGKWIDYAFLLVRTKYYVLTDIA